MLEHCRGRIALGNVAWERGERVLIIRSVGAVSTEEKELTVEGVVGQAVVGQRRGNEGRTHVQPQSSRGVEGPGVALLISLAVTSGQEMLTERIVVCHRMRVPFPWRDCGIELGPKVVLGIEHPRIRQVSGTAHATVEENVSCCLVVGHRGPGPFRGAKVQRQLFPYVVLGAVEPGVRKVILAVKSPDHPHQVTLTVIRHGRTLAG